MACISLKETNNNQSLDYINEHGGVYFFIFFTFFVI